MGNMNLTIDDALERQFRQVAFIQKGMKSGHLRNATEEAIRVWLGVVKLRQMSTNKNDRLWPEELEALEDIKTGKTKMVRQSGEDFLKQLDAVIDAKD
jgi:hypothetical protein